VNGQDTQKEYGDHKYENYPGTSECKNGCGCRMSGFQSWGPLGIDPFGKCPGNPKDGKSLGGNKDYEYVVSQRIDNLESELREAKRQLEAVSPGKIKLAEELSFTKEKLQEREKALRQICDLSKTNKLL
jgi:hypothetical protein